MSKICGACDTRHYIHEDCPNSETSNSNEFLLAENRELKSIISFMVNKEIENAASWQSRIQELEIELEKYHSGMKCAHGCR